MREKIGMRTILGSAFLLSAAALAMAGCGDGGAAVSAAQAEAPGVRVLAVGCPAPGRQAGCVTMSSKGVAYDVTGAGIDLSKGKNVSLTGTSRGEAGLCGVKLTEVKFDYSALNCSLPPVPDNSPIPTQ
jgi:hypothetical protein